MSSAWWGSCSSMCHCVPPRTKRASLPMTKSASTQFVWSAGRTTAQADCSRYVVCIARFSGHRLSDELCVQIKRTKNYWISVRRSMERMWTIKSELESNAMWSTVDFCRVSVIKQRTSLERFHQIMTRWECSRYLSSSQWSSMAAHLPIVVH